MRPWSTGDVGSFAQRTLAVRVPKILDDTVGHNRFSADVVARCRSLRDELTHGRLRALVDDAADKAAWDEACAPHVGKGWLEVPWYFAESYFYRRLLEATQYFAHGVDPFLVVKLAEEQHAFPKARAFADSIRAADARSPAGLLRELVQLSLWGNRVDLSYAVGVAHGAAGGADDLLVDDSDRALSLLDGARVALLLDNAGTELAFDLLLADRLQATLFCKAQPFFVSDATAVDVERTRVALGLAARDVVTHPYMTSSGMLRTAEMPADLVAALRSFDVVISKGDANYRRLVNDAPWPHDTPVEVAMDFPTTVLALRTLKAEVLVGVRDDVASRAQARDAEWLVSGRFGVIQLSKPNGP